MRRDDYPPQEPLSEAGTAYGEACWQKGAGVAFDEFAYGSDPYQRLLVCKAARPDGRVLLFWHGGGWTSGYKEWMAFMAPAFNAAGVTFVSAGYRLAPQHLFPTGLDDSAETLRWVLQNIAAHGGDPDSVFVGGHSSGGHYAALLAVTGSARARPGIPKDAVKGCLPLSGVYEFGAGSGLSIRPRFLGNDAANDEAASPLLHLHAAMPPFLVAYGTRDFPHLIPQAERFAHAVNLAGGEAQLLPLSERTHFTASFAGAEADGPWVPAALAFMAWHASARARA
jgi:acetyl esterase/lipase